MALLLILRYSRSQAVVFTGFYVHINLSSSNVTPSGCHWTCTTMNMVTFRCHKLTVLAIVLLPFGEASSSRCSLVPASAGDNYGGPKRPAACTFLKETSLIGVLMARRQVGGIHGCTNAGF